MCDDLPPDISDPREVLRHLLRGDLLVVTHREGRISLWTLQNANKSCAISAINKLRDEPWFFAPRGKLSPDCNSLFRDDPRLANEAQCWRWEK